MQVVPWPVVALDETALTDDDVGVPRLDQLGRGVARRRQQHHVAVGERGEVGDQTVQGVAALDEHQSPGRAEQRRGVVDTTGEVGVRHAAGGRVDRDPPPVGGEVEHAGCPDLAGVLQQRHPSRVLGKPYLTQSGSGQAGRQCTSPVTRTATSLPGSGASSPGTRATRVGPSGSRSRRTAASWP